MFEPSAQEKHADAVRGGKGHGRLLRGAYRGSGRSGLNAWRVGKGPRSREAVERPARQEPASAVAASQSRDRKTTPPIGGFGGVSSDFAQVAIVAPRPLIVAGRGDSQMTRKRPPARVPSAAGAAGKRARRPPSA